MSENFSYLCSLIIEDLYGNFPAQIFLNIAKHGRQSLGQIAQKCRLPSKQVKHGVSSLVALRLIYHHASPTGMTLYQANNTAAYNLVRVGKILQEVCRNYGDLAEQCISELLTCGYATFPELVANICQRIKLEQKQSPSQDDDLVDDEVSTRRIRVVLQRLVDEHFIVRARRALAHSYFDARRDLEVQISKNATPANTKGKKSAAAIETEMQIQHDLEVQIDDQLPDSIVRTSILAGLKRDSDETDVASPAKRRKLQAGRVDPTPAPAAEESEPNELEYVVCVNLEAIVKSLRTRKLVEMSTKKLGLKAASVLKAALEQLPTLSHPWKPPDPPCSDADWVNLDLVGITQSITMHADSQEEAEGQQNGHKTNGVHHHPNKGTQNTRNDVSTVEEVEQCLSLMSEGPFEFISQDTDTYGNKRWRCDNRALAQHLQDDEVLSFIKGQVGQHALRLIRMLQKRGRLDEKCIQEFGLLNAKDLRQTLAELHTKGFLHIQEVPRDPQRQPNRTIFLWFYESLRVRKHILDILYKMMTKLMQRMMMEREKLSSTLSKAERKEVRGSEEEVFGAAELQVFRDWQRREQWFLGEINRLDDCVIVLRDV